MNLRSALRQAHCLSVLDHGNVPGLVWTKLMQ